MKAKAISFTPEVLKAKLRALEEYGQAQTRRPVVVPRTGYAEANLSKAWPDPTSPFGSCLKVPCEDDTVQRLFPPHHHGDRLWVRERARVVAFNATEAEVRIQYDDGECRYILWPERIKRPVVGRCIPTGVHREGARHFLEVVAVRAERVADISEQDALLEGIAQQQIGSLGAPEWGTGGMPALWRPSPTTAYFALYDSIYGTGAHATDWCWVYTLKRAAP